MHAGCFVQFSDIKGTILRNWGELVVADANEESTYGTMEVSDKEKARNDKRLNFWNSNRFHLFPRISAVPYPI